VHVPLVDSETRTLFTVRRLNTGLWRKRIKIHEHFIICVFSSVSRFLQSTVISGFPRPHRAGGLPSPRLPFAVSPSSWQNSGYTRELVYKLSQWTWNTTLVPGHTYVL